MMVVVLDSSFIFFRAGLSEGMGAVSTSQRKLSVRGVGTADNRYENGLQFNHYDGLSPKTDSSRPRAGQAAPRLAV